MEFLAKLVSAFTRFVQWCAITIGALISGMPKNRAEAGSNSSHSKGKIVAAAACTFAIILSVTRIVMTMVGPSLKADVRPYAALGTVCAQETFKLLGGHGEVVVVAWDS